MVRRILGFWKYRSWSFNRWSALIGHTSAGRGINGTDMVGCVLSCRHTSSLSGGVFSGFKAPQRGSVYRLVPEAPFFREMPTGSEAFLRMPACLGYGPAPGPILKKVLCHTRPYGGTVDKYRWSAPLGFSDLIKADQLGSRQAEILFTNPSARAGYDTRSIFKRSLTGFNSEFSFS